MRYSVDTDIFNRYPGFMRAVVIADDIRNNEKNPELAGELRACEQHAREALGDDFKDLPQLSAWADAFRSMDINPNKYPPSVVNLVKRARSGKPLPYVNSLVAVFNCISLRNLCPCGGDDLAVVGGDLLLAFAEGTETYIPLGQPEATEHPPKGEVIYMDTATRDVFCRAWCWKNGDKSKLTPATTWAAVNIDIMSPLGLTDAERIAGELRAMLEKYTGAKTAIHYLTAHDPEFAVTRLT